MNIKDVSFNCVFRTDRRQGKVREISYQNVVMQFCPLFGIIYFNTTGLSPQFVNELNDNKNSFFALALAYENGFMLGFQSNNLNEHPVATNLLSRVIKDFSAGMSKEDIADLAIACNTAFYRGTEIGKHCID